MKLFNTITRQAEEVKPLAPPNITLYTCGPTVYDYQHIGNFRTFLFDDLLRRTLTSAGYTVNHVMNITDVGHLVSDGDDGEDKLEKGASREGKTAWEVADYYANVFISDVQKLNILPPNVQDQSAGSYARATGFIKQQIDIVQLLLDKNFAYQADEAIYFDTSKLPTYGELTKQKLADKEVGVRSEVVTDSEKRNPQDFAIWFFTTGRFAQHSMHWPSPWGEGFPGWHLECSAIIHSLLGDPIDIHTGGVDNIGTHHVNEMAQTEAAFGHKLATLWVHGEHLLVDDQKMSKSKNNFYTLGDIEARKIDPMAFRLLALQAHYRSRLNFTWDNLSAAAQRLLRWQSVADLRWQLLRITIPDQADKLTNSVKQLTAALQNDLDSPQALTAIEAGLDAAQDGVSFEAEPAFRALLETINDLLGIDLLASPDVTAEDYEAIQQRQAARESNDWDKADKLRKDLLLRGITIRDTGQNTFWSRAT